MPTRNKIAERVASAAAYLPLLGRVILLFLPTRRSPGVRFHVFQATLFGFASSVLLGGLFCYRHVHCIACLLKAAAIADLALLITLASMAFLARPIALPVLGAIARKLAEAGNIRRALVFVNSSRPAGRNAKSVVAAPILNNQRAEPL
jgi:uncharacterized membrane protein